MENKCQHRHVNILQENLVQFVSLPEKLFPFKRFSIDQLGINKHLSKMFILYIYFSGIYPNTMKLMKDLVI